MDINVESHFSQLPSVDIERSIMDRSHRHITSFNVGDVIPVYISEILPGDSVKMTTSKVVRLQTLLTPIMDNLYLDVGWFFIPNRLTWSHWRELCGENTSSAWVPSVTYQVPSISAPSGGFAKGTIADYLGLPTGINWSNTAEMRPSALPFRAYALVCDQFYRDENLTSPLNIPLGDANQTGTNGSSYINDVANGGMPFKAAKFHDYFTSALPSPLKAAQPVTFPLIAGSKAPVVTNATELVTGAHAAATWRDSSGSQQSGDWDIHWHSGLLDRGAQVSQSNYGGIYPTNLYADLSTSVGAVSINQLRLAFQLQKFYERAARSGSRYIEVLKAHFSVTSPDARLQRPEYLGGNRVPLQISEVTNSAQTTTDFLGDLGAKSATADVHEDFEKSFTEHGFLLGLAVVRYKHSYAQGLEKFWTRRNFEDYYWPVFANLGEMPVFTSEICATGTNMTTASVFGYQEAWADYRYHPDRISGEMRPGISGTLASWHLSDYYDPNDPVPTLSDSWIREDKGIVDRVLAVSSANADQCFGEFFFKAIYTRPMPMYSIPGLIDHH